MALDQSALSELLDALRAGGDLVVRINSLMVGSPAKTALRHETW
jgi:hypothetical protein